MSVSSTHLPLPKAFRRTIWVTMFKSRAQLLLEQLSSALDAYKGFRSQRSYFGDTTTTNTWPTAIDNVFDELAVFKSEISLLVARSERVYADVRLCPSYELLGRQSCLL